MKILKMGGITDKVTCHACKSELEVEPTDIHSNTYRDIDGSVDTDYYTECPVCRARINFSPYSKIVKAYCRSNG